jgi:predicted DNA-binding transcriptional regulator AlpA
MLPRDQLLDAEQLAMRWQVRPSHVYRLTRKGVIPRVPLGRYYRYRLDLIEEWERNQAGGEDDHLPGTPAGG